MKYLNRLSVLFLLVIIVSLISYKVSLADTPFPFQTKSGNAVVMATTSPNQALDANLYVSDIVLDQTTYNDGDTVTGNFVLHNPSTIPASNASYIISLVGNYKPNTLAGTFYDTKSFGPVFLDAGQSKSISFRYSLPKGISGQKLGIEIQAISYSGQPLGWSDSFLTVKGDNLPFVSVTKSMIVVGSKTYGLQVGPIVGKNQDVSLKMTFSNDSNSSITLSPDVVIFDRAIDRTVLSEDKANSIVVPAKSSTTTIFALSTFDYNPKIYAGEISFKDSEGNTRASTVDFRYIVDGAIATIQGITSDKQWADKNDAVNLQVVLTGSPYNVDTVEVPKVGSTTLSVSLKNEHGQVVSSSTQIVDIDSLSGPISVPLIVNARASTLDVVATLSKDGKILDSYESTLSGSPHEFAKFPVVGVLVVVIIIALIFSAFILKRKKYIVPIIFLFVLGGSGLFFAQNVLAQFVLTGYMTSYWAPNPSGASVLDTSGVRNPSVSFNPITIENGQYYLTGVITAQVCYNQPANIFVTISYPDTNGSISYQGSKYTSISEEFTDPAGTHYAELNSINRPFTADNTGKNQVSFGPFPAVFSTKSNTSQNVYVDVQNRRWWYAGELVTFGQADGYVSYTSPLTTNPSGTCVNGDTNPPDCTTPPVCTTPSTCNSSNTGTVDCNGKVTLCTGGDTCNGGVCSSVKSCGAGQCLNSSGVCINSTSTCSPASGNIVDSCGSVTAYCSNGCVAGTSTCNPNPSSPNVSFSLTTSPKFIQLGSQCTVSWNVQNAISCTLKGAGLNNGYVIPLDAGGNSSGSKQSNNLTSSAVYTLNCSNKTENVSTSATCSVAPSIIEN